MLTWRRPWVQCLLTWDMSPPLCQPVWHTRSSSPTHAPLFASWHRCSHCGTIVYFMASLFTWWHHFWFHGTIFNFMSPFLDLWHCIWVLVCPMHATKPILHTWHAQHGVPGQICLAELTIAAPNSKHVKMQTMQTQAASKPSRVWRVCLTDLGVEEQTKWL